MEKKTRILLLEDDQVDAKTITMQLQKENINFEAERVFTKNDFINKLQIFKPDIILADYHLPSFTGIEALTVTNELNPNLPFIFITGSQNEETRTHFGLPL